MCGLTGTYSRPTRLFQDGELIVTRRAHTRTPETTQGAPGHPDEAEPGAHPYTESERAG
ncbi:hypothetical protein STTU_1767 [Streptomyces sp. Tu6071]|nr:hypothetical protein STTU_1767 [Streptomyces sp. Tu6071]